LPIEVQKAVTYTDFTVIAVGVTVDEGARVAEGRGILLGCDVGIGVAD